MLWKHSHLELPVLTGWLEEYSWTCMQDWDELNCTHRMHADRLQMQLVCLRHSSLMKKEALMSSIPLIYIPQIKRYYFTLLSLSFIFHIGSLSNLSFLIRTKNYLHCHSIHFISKFILAFLIVYHKPQIWFSEIFNLIFFV